MLQISDTLLLVLALRCAQLILAGESFPSPLAVGVYDCNGALEDLVVANVTVRAPPQTLRCREITFRLLEICSEPSKCCYQILRDVRGAETSISNPDSEHSIYDPLLDFKERLVLCSRAVRT